MLHVLTMKLSLFKELLRFKLRILIDFHEKIFY